MKHFSFLALLACCPNSCGSHRTAPKPAETAPAQEPSKQFVSLDREIEALVAQQNAELSAQTAKNRR